MTLGLSSTGRERECIWREDNKWDEGQKKSEYSYYLSFYSFALVSR